MTSAPAARAGRDALRRRARLERTLLLAPGLAYLTVFTAVPVLLVVVLTVFRRGRFGGVVYEATAENFTRALEPLYLQVLGSSLVIAALTTVLALLLGYPTAYAIAQLSPRWRTVALVAVVLPFWTNFLIRTYAWIVLLNSEGPLNRALVGVGLVDAPLELLYTRGAVVAGLLYAYLPLMILPLYASIERLDPQLREAAANLGAPPWRVFRDVTLPLTAPAALSGALFVFVPSLGNFVVPELLGGGKTVTVGTLVRDQFLEARDWPFGAVLALAVIAVLVALFAAQSWAARRITGGAAGA